MILLALLHSALAADPTDIGSAGDGSGPATSSSKSITDFLSDLDGDNPGDRAVAARSLRGQTERALRVESRGRLGSLAYDDARSTLFELEQRLPEKCLSALSYENVVRSCADIFAMLEVVDAIEPLRATLTADTAKRTRKHVEDAIATLEAIKAAAPPPPPLPLVTTASTPGPPIALPPFLPPPAVPPAGVPAEGETTATSEGATPTATPGTSPVPGPTSPPVAPPELGASEKAPPKQAP